MDEIQHLPEGQTIYEAARDCLHKFEAWPYDKDSGLIAAVARNQRRFRSWAAYLGVFARGKTSLDSRLKNEPDIRELVMLLLGVLCSDLHHTLIISGDDTSNQHLSTATTRDGDAVDVQHPLGMQKRIEGGLRGIVGSIDRLHRLGLRIRRARRNEETLEAKIIAFSKRRDLEFKDFEAIATLYLGDKFPGADAKLREKLVKSVTIRMYRLLYKRHHQNKLSYPRNSHEEETAPDLTSGGEEDQDHKEDEPRKRNTNGQRTAARDGSQSVIDSISDTTASEFSKRQFQGQEDFKDDGSTTSTHSSSSSSIGSSSYPLPPRAKLGDEHVTCLYCLQELEVDATKSTRWWRNHVDRDFQHYVCISETCLRPLYYFKSSRKWLEHMDTEHRHDWTQHAYPEAIEWRCNLHSGNDVVLPDRESLKMHLQTLHLRDLNSADLDIVANSSRVPRPRKPDVCLLCQNSINKHLRSMASEELPEKSTRPTTVRFANTTSDSDERDIMDQHASNEALSQKSSRKMAKHVARHLKQLSLFLTCRLLNDEDPDSETVESDDTSSREDSLPATTDSRSDHSGSNDGQSSPMDRATSNDVFNEGTISFDQQSVSSQSSDESWSSVVSNLPKQYFMLRLVRPSSKVSKVTAQRQFLSGKDFASSDSVRAEPRFQARRLELQVQLRQAYQEVDDPMSPSPGKHFIPKKQLYSIVNSKSVARELAQKMNLHKHDVEVRKLTETVCMEQTAESFGGKTRVRSWRSILAILVLIEQSDHIKLFIEENVSDLDLPIACVDHVEPNSQHGGNDLYRMDSQGDPHGEPLQCAMDWSPERRKQFYENQWLMLAPLFRPGEYNHVNHYNLRDGQVLPFIESINGNDDIDQKRKVHGGFSQVFFVNIHPEHHEFNGFGLDAERGFAVKQLADDSHQADEKFRSEVNILKKFTGDGAHPHVLSVLATYEQFGKFHLIFPIANADLFTYWSTIRPSPIFDYDTVVWVAKQLSGLADGLLRLHRHYTAPKILEGDQDQDVPPYHTNKTRSTPSRKPLELQYGRHGDIKPHNLLWFSDQDDSDGILKITDFGQAELSSEEIEDRRSWGIDTLTYRPPEGEIEPRTMRQSSDIWSLGCVYLEFVTWTFDGDEGLQAFKTSRLSYDHRLRMKSDTFFESVRLEGLQHEAAKLKHSVSKHIEDLASRADCSAYFKDVLGLIREMVVIESLEDHDAPNRRRNCGEVSVFLKKAYEKCKNARSYAMGDNDL